MADLIAFDSWDDAQRHMREVEAQLDGQLTPIQRAVKDAADVPHYWMQFTSYGFDIFGRTFSRDELIADVKRAFAKYGGDDEELAGEIAMYDDVRERGYLTGNAYSVACPEGELGDTHVSQIIPISEAMFESARASGWVRGR
jgi:hypothetical protein